MLERESERKPNFRPKIYLFLRIEKNVFRSTCLGKIEFINYSALCSVPAFLKNVAINFIFKFSGFVLLLSFLIDSPGILINSKW